MQSNAFERSIKIAPTFSPLSKRGSIIGGPISA